MYRCGKRRGIWPGGGVGWWVRDFANEAKVRVIEEVAGGYGMVNVKEAMYSYRAGVMNIHAYWLISSEAVVRC